MSGMRFAVASFGLMVLAAGAACGQNYPHKSIRIVASGPASNTDFAARLIAQELTPGLGQQVIVENRPSGVIPGQVVAQAQPDGYTLLVTSSSLWIGPLMQKTPYDPVKDFAPISLVMNYPSILVVHPSVPAKSVKELIDLAKAKPGVLNYGSPTLGSPTHLASEMFKALAGVNITRVNYKGSSPALNALIGGEVQVMFVASASVAPHVSSGKVRALGVTSAQPSPLVPGVPPIAAAVPNYEMGGVTGMFAPAGTPAAVISRLNREVVRILNKADVKERAFNVGTETVGTSPAELAATIKSDMATLGKLIRDAGIVAE